MIKQRKYKKNHILQVFFRDIIADPSWQGNKKSMEEEPDDMCVAVGYFYKWDKHRLYISSMVGMGTRDKMTIPIGTIERIVIVKEK